MGVSACNQRPDSLALCEVLMKAGDRVQKADAAHVGSSGAFSASTPHQRHLQGLQLTMSRHLLVGASVPMEAVDVCPPKHAFHSPRRWRQEMKVLSKTLGRTGDVLNRIKSPHSVHTPSTFSFRFSSST